MKSDWHLDAFAYYVSGILKGQVRLFKRIFSIQIFKTGAVFKNVAVIVQLQLLKFYIKKCIIYVRVFTRDCNQMLL